MQEIAQSGATLICLQELDHIDDFYEPAFKELGFNLIYGKRSQSHTIAIAYKTDEWSLIDSDQIDLGEIKSWHQNEPSYARATNKNALLCLL